MDTRVSPSIHLSRHPHIKQVSAGSYAYFFVAVATPQPPLLTPALNHAVNIISRHQRELRRRLLTIATSMTLLTDLESLLESFLGKYRRSEPLP
jgi:hypothetical protein